MLLAAGTAYSQSSAEVQAMKKQIQDLQAGQAALKKDMDDLKRMLRGPQPKEDATLSVEGSPYMGDARAKVTVIEFSDYQCPFCARHASATLPQLMTDYVKTGKVKYVLRDFPLEGLHPAALRAAQAARCAGEQGKYWEMHDKLINNPKSVDAKGLSDQAKGLGMNTGDFDKCVQSGKYAEKVKRDLQDGQEAGVSGTPTFFVGLTDPHGPNVKTAATLVGAQPYSKFKETIDGLLAGKK